MPVKNTVKSCGRGKQLPSVTAREKILIFDKQTCNVTNLCALNGHVSRPKIQICRGAIVDFGSISSARVGKTVSRRLVLRHTVRGTELCSRINQIKSCINFDSILEKGCSGSVFNANVRFFISSIQKWNADLNSPVGVLMASFLLTPVEYQLGYYSGCICLNVKYSEQL